MKKSFNSTNWIGLIYSYFDNEIISKFDDVINITGSAKIISKKISQTTEKCICHDPNQEELPERETEMLIQLVKGLSNKEMADRLNKSIHSVISHRQNMIEKTGIRSLPGLTIHAISKKIAPLNSNQLLMIRHSIPTRRDI